VLPKRTRDSVDNDYPRVVSLHRHAPFIVDDIAFNPLDSRLERRHPIPYRRRLFFASVRKEENALAGFHLW